MLEREILEPVLRTGRVEQIARDHRVRVEPAELDAVTREQDGVELQVVTDLGDRGILEHRSQGVERGLERAAQATGPSPRWPVGT